jgi:hypothetical protein
MYLSAPWFSLTAQLKEQLGRAQRQLKNAQKRDYYKILNVPRNADEDTVHKVLQCDCNINIIQGPASILFLVFLLPFFF